VSSPQEVLIRAGQLAARGEAFALATVVDVVRPTSARLGDRALVNADGTLEGWVGGACSEPVVIREALRALADGAPRLVRIGPEDSGCASEGTVELLVEPQLPTPLLAVVGESPAAQVLADLALRVGWRVTGDVTDSVDAVVVATMGHGDEDTLARALRTGAGYVGLVASAKRAATVLAALEASGFDEEALVRVRSPAGLDLGPLRQEEIAVAILAELVSWRHAREAPAAAPVEAVDPVCGMTVVAGSGEHAFHAGTTYWFCGAGCRRRFEQDPARYLTTSTK
jgi:xanthine dehydrogenase accessory factor